MVVAKAKRALENSTVENKQQAVVCNIILWIGPKLSYVELQGVCALAEI
jgi:hypothetical protein